jgi:integrase
MSSTTVRFWRGAWVVDISERTDGKRQRTIKTFGAGAKAKAAAQAYATDKAPQAKGGKYWERQSATFADLWDKFAAHELTGSDRRPSTVADYKALARLYLVPHLGACRLADIDTEVIMTMKSALQAEPGSKAAGKEGSGKPLSARSVAKVLILGGTVWRYGRRIKLVDGSPFSDVKKPRAAKRVPYILDAGEIGRLRIALDVPAERLLVELTLMTGLRSGEIRGLIWESIDLEGKRLFVERQASRRGEEAATKTESSVRPVPLPAYLIPELKRWKLACPITQRGLVFPCEPNARGERGPIDADKLLRHILRRALRRAGLPALRFHDLRHMAGTLMHEAGVSLKRAQEILGHASERTTLAIYTHSMRRTHDDSADKIAVLAGLAPASNIPGNNGETIASVEPQEAAVSDCFLGSRGWNRTNDQRINSPSLYR